MKKLLSLLFALFTFAILFAQDSTATSGGGFTSNKTVLIIAAIVLGIYEVVARKIPTVKNYSVLGVIITIIQKIFPNNSINSSKLP